MNLLPFEVTDTHLIMALVIKILIIAFAWWKIKFLTALAGGLDTEKRNLKEEINKHIDNEAVLKREINELNHEIADLNEQLDHVRSNCSDFENEMGKAQLEALALEEKVKAIEGEKASLNKSLSSQKAHHGKQKKKIETQDKAIEEMESELYGLRYSIDSLVKTGYLFVKNQYYKAVKVTAPAQKKQAQQALDNLNK